MATEPNIALYIENSFSKIGKGEQELQALANSLSASGFTTIILGLFHVHSEGAMYYNDTALTDLPTFLPGIIRSLKTGSNSTVTKVLLSIGGGNWPGHPASVSDSDYPALFAHWTTPGSITHGGVTTKVPCVRDQILGLLADWDLDGVDLDYEPVTTPFDSANIIKITNDLAQTGHLVTAAPYADQGDWETVIRGTAIKGEGGQPAGNRFAWWNLQIYSGMASYGQWVSALEGVDTGLTGAQLQAFMLPGYKPGCFDLKSKRSTRVPATQRNLRVTGRLPVAQRRLHLEPRGDQRMRPGHGRFFESGLLTAKERTGMVEWGYLLERVLGGRKRPLSPS